jgi:hypothetical protein
MAAAAPGVGARPGWQGKQRQHAADQDDRGLDEEPEIRAADERGAGDVGEQVTRRAADPGRDAESAADRAEDGVLDRVRQMVRASAEFRAEHARGRPVPFPAVALARQAVKHKPG